MENIRVYKRLEMQAVGITTSLLNGLEDGTGNSITGVFESHTDERKKLIDIIYKSTQSQPLKIDIEDVGQGNIAVTLEYTGTEIANGNPY